MVWVFISWYEYNGRCKKKIIYNTSYSERLLFMWCESLESPIPGVEDDFPALQEFVYDDGLQNC
jgi:hypothetical protein